MTPTAQPAPTSETIAAAFEHSITWEDDIWRADPVDVEEVHADAREKFFGLLKAIARKEPQPAPARIMLFHGQSGAGKTHLIRALRTSAHSQELAYFGYAQMTPDVGSYADFFLRRLINSLEKNYDPHDPLSESGLQRMTRKLVEESGAVSAEALERLRDGDLETDALANLVLDLADDIVASPEFAEQDLDINIVRALLYLQRSDTRIDQRVRQYLFGRELNEMSQATVPALDPNTGEGRAFEIIEALGRIMHTVDNAALVFCIDQVEDLRFFDNSEERFQRAVRDLIQIANCLPTAIVVISCLEDFYGQVRGVVAQSYIDRIEKSGPVLLREARTGEEAKLIIAKRLAQDATAAPGKSKAPAQTDPIKFFGPNFVDEFGGLSPRRLLELAQARIKSRFGPKSRDESEAPGPDASSSLISTLAAALGFGASEPTADPEAPASSAPAAPTANASASTAASSTDPNAPDYRDVWDRFSTAFEAEVATDDDELLDV
ncbi:MAG: ATP-binding protein, partial [Pseudomonadota bacterium]